jgi:hypothetical protein
MKTLLKGVVLVFVIAAVMAFPMMWLMNYLFASSFLQFVFGVTQFTFWKAFWLNFLCGILIRSSPPSSSPVAKGRR